MYADAHRIRTFKRAYTIWILAIIVQLQYILYNIPILKKMPTTIRGSTGKTNSLRQSIRKKEKERQRELSFPLRSSTHWPNNWKERKRNTHTITHVERVNSTEFYIVSNRHIMKLLSWCWKFIDDLLVLANSSKLKRTHRENKIRMCQWSSIGSKLLKWLFFFQCRLRCHIIMIVSMNAFTNWRNG